MTTVEKAEKALTDATEAYRAKPSEKTKAAYRKANDDLAAARAAERADRVELVGGDAVADEGGDT